MKQIPIPTIDLFPVLDKHLIKLLRSLSADEWNKPTLARLWSVRDVAAHLLDGNIRGIAMYRDGYFGDPPPVIRSWLDLVTFLNELNAGWVRAMRRVSPQLLTEQLEETGKHYHHELTRLDPFSEAVFSVAWAGEDVSFNWFHIAREYTEKFHHQLQIREAVGRTGEIMTPELFRPFIKTLLMGLPHAYRDTEAGNGTIIEIEITGGAGGNWVLVKDDNSWKLDDKQGGEMVSSTVSITADTAWKLFTKGIKPEQAGARITGDTGLGETALKMVAVMA